MDIKINIPNYPNICRVCFVEIRHTESCVSVKDQLKNGASYWTLVHELCSLGLEQEPNENDTSESLPQYICNNCTKQIDLLQTFKSETVANQLFLNAWIAFKYRADAGPLRDLFHIQVSYHDAIRKTLRRIKILEDEDVCLETLINDSEEVSSHLEVKFEVKNEPLDIEDPLLNSVYSEFDNGAKEQNNYDHQTCEDEDGFGENSLVALKDQKNAGDNKPPKKRKRKVDLELNIDGVSSRPCYLENCEPIPVGQGEKHIREKHRAYCKICGMVFLSHSQAVHHVAIHKSDEDRYRCEVCDKPYWRELDLKLHRRDFHGIDVANHECPYCDEKFQRKADMLQHRETHTVCKFCPKQSKFYKTMLKHARERHRDQLKSCKSCQAVFLGAKELDMHEKAHLEGREENCIQFPIKNWTPAHCQTCVRDLFNQEYLLRHNEQAHTHGLSEKPPRNRNFKNRTKEELDKLEYKYKCDDCSAKFRLKTSLKGHWRKNHSGEKFICEHCGACFKSRAEMMMHDRYLHAKITPFACDFCDKRCHTKNDLKIHRRSHTNEKPYKCWHEGCDKAYKTRSAVTKHFRIHTGEKPYKCSYEGCDKSYACSQLLKVHRRKHTLEKPFKCYYCELYFDSTNNRRKHCHRHHAGLPIGRELERLNQQGAKGNSTGESTEHSEGSRSAEMPVKQEVDGS
ncbi:AAEL014289-PA [Aedes aegypti]|uniref:AAEL014289-PA n=1 Tax=Aedes aegypti TaxID=7159 RepID=Q16GR6_AEDAE|nr:AAEL014289-PA [Aedes aegypti]